MSSATFHTTYEHVLQSSKLSWFLNIRGKFDNCIHALFQPVTIRFLIYFVSYTLFPLLLLLDAAVDCRSTPKEDSRGRSIISNFPETPLKVGDILGEGVLNCLEELLKKCHLASVDQVFKHEDPFLY